MVHFVGPYALPDKRRPVLLAPMSGVTDAPFRKQANLYGASVTVTEMVAGDDLLAGRREATQRMERFDEHGPFVVQLVGREAAPLKAGAQMARKAGADVIDINMGCPSRRVTGGLSGSALMRDLARAEQLIEAVLQGAEHVPVTLKMRLGWDWDNLNAPELAQIAERLGVKMLTVHGRTRQDFYTGEANWDEISNVVKVVNLPVIANGDIYDEQSAERALLKSGAAGIMVGRAATGLAWLPSALETALAKGSRILMPSLSRQADSLKAQASDSIELYGERVGIKTVRKHLAAAFEYWEGLADQRHLKSLKGRACQAVSYDELSTVLGEVSNQHMLEAVA